MIGTSKTCRLVNGGVNGNAGIGGNVSESAITSSTERNRLAVGDTVYLLPIEMISPPLDEVTVTGPAISLSVISNGPPLPM